MTSVPTVAPTRAPWHRRAALAVVLATTVGLGCTGGTGESASDVTPVTEATTTTTERATTTTAAPATTTTTAPPTTTTTTAPPTTTTTAPPPPPTTTTAPPPPPPPPTTAAPPPTTAAPSSGCDPNYSGCVPIDSDVDCASGSGNGPSYTSGPVQVIGSDVYGLDNDGDGIGCENG